MTKLLYMIVVSDGFRTFLHVHPVLQTDGHFTIDLPLPARERYFVYTDSRPQGLSQQVFSLSPRARGILICKRHPNNDESGGSGRRSLDRKANPRDDVGYDTSLIRSSRRIWRL